jgi:stalled ribosome rescue protein Dom34
MGAQSRVRAASSRTAKLPPRASCNGAKQARHAAAVLGEEECTAACIKSYTTQNAQQQQRRAGTV